MPIPKVIIGCKNCHCPLAFMNIIEKTPIEKTPNDFINSKHKK